VTTNLDGASFTDPALFQRCLLDGFTEVPAHIPAPGRPSRAAPQSETL